MISEDLDMQIIGISPFLRRLARHADVLRRRRDAGDALIGDNFPFLYRVYVGITEALKNVRALPAGTYGAPRVFERATDFCRIGAERADAEKLRAFLRLLAEEEELTGTEISVLPALLSAGFLVQISQTRETSVLLAALSYLRQLEDLAAEDLYAKMSRCEAVLCEDAYYERMDRQTKDLYRFRIAQEAEKNGVSETEKASVLLAEAQERYADGHIGHLLFPPRKTGWYLALTVGLCAACSALVGLLCGGWVGVLSVLPLFEAVKAWVDFVCSRLFPACHVPAMNTEKGCPKTLVATVTVLRDKAGIEEVLQKTERCFFANRCEGLRFGILADLPEANSPVCEQDRELLFRLQEGVERLNFRYGGHFFCAVRRRTPDGEGTFSGWERKRGAILQFLQATRGIGTDAFSVLMGDLTDAAYFCALDGDTVPAPDSVRKLVGVLLHPLSRPVRNAEGTAVVSGFGIAAPRMDVELSSASANLFTQLISGSGGAEVYGNASFSLQQDLFGEGIFAGKGVLDVELFLDLMPDLFPDRAVLSHDVLEGGFLRCAYVSDAAFFDGVPSGILPYVRRLHRWIRGDVQNVPELASYIRTRNGKMRNPLSVRSRLRILDNLRRALTLPAVFLLLFAGLFFGTVPFVLALAVLYTPALIYAVSQAGAPASASAHFAKPFAPAMQTFLRCTLDLLYLPYLAVQQTDAVVRALFRLLRGKRLLEWTTAADAEKKNRKTWGGYLFAVKPQLLALLFLLRPAGIPLAAIWILGAAFAYFLFLPQKPNKNDRSVFDDLQKMWQYFSDFMTPENNGLPPDNFQERPLGVAAYRTSPTNIGLAALCCLGAYDCGLILRDELFSRLSLLLDSVENMERWHGHLYNWYDTKTLQPLHPRFVSSVDNGNLVCCFYALKNGLLSLHDREAVALSERLEHAMTSMDFSLLYDCKKHLFFIGYDVERKEKTPSRYDLYASESRMLSYFSVATRQVPLRHWQNLNRFPFRARGRIGIKSWSGTAFEYFMPALLLPVEKGSLCEEMLRFAADSQQRAAGSRPWGVSESCYNAFDASLVYQYRAFGTPELALRPDAPDEYVVAPYASYLALPFLPEEAFRNLDRLRQHGMFGKYGFYEALDMTPSRVGNGEEPVCCYMAHHLAMSFLSCVNYEKNFIMQKRFMDPRTDAYRSLLQEKIPVSAVRWRDVPPAPVYRKPYFSRPAEITHMNPEHPVVRSYSDGILSSVMTDSGLGGLTWKDRDVTRFRDTDDPHGVFVLAKTERELLPLTFAPLYRSGVSYRTTFGEDEGCYMSAGRELEGRMSVTVGSGCAEVREIALKNNAVSRRDGNLLVYFEPTLCRRDAERAHPAFCGLFTEAFFEEDVLLFHRRPRESAKEEMWLAVACSRPYTFSLSRFDVLDRLDGVSRLDRALSRPFPCETAGPVDPCSALKIPFSVPGRGIYSLQLALSVGETKEEVRQAVRNAVKAPFDHIRSSYASRMRALRSGWQMTGEADVLCGVLTDAIYGRSAGAPKSRLGRDRLWRFGISGDLPLVTIKTDPDTVGACDAFLKAKRGLLFRNMAFDLVFCFSDNGRYDRPTYVRLTERIRDNGLEREIGRYGGVFLADLSDTEELGLLSGISCFYADLSHGWSVPEDSPAYRAESLSTGVPVPVTYRLRTGIGGFTDQGFAIDDKDILPSRPPWCHVLASATFGTVVSDSSLGFSYALDSQQNRLTPWENDAVRDQTGERLVLSCPEGMFDVIRSASAEFRRGFAVYEALCGRVRVRCEVFVSPTRMAKLLRVHLVNEAETPCMLAYRCRIVLGRNSRIPPRRTVRHRDILYENPLNPYAPQGVCYLTGSGVSVRSGVMTAYVGGKTTSDVYFVLGYEKNEQKASEDSYCFRDFSFCEAEYEAARNRVEQAPFARARTADREMDFLYNTLLTAQVEDCRLAARSGFYQCSGAYGFRDQLQDAIGMVTLDASLLRQQILRASARQFVEGDVMHWWQTSETPCGVRTRSSDDLLWLPYALAEYETVAGDFSLAEIPVPYLEAEPLAEGESERYGEARVSEMSGSVYEHGKAALRHAVQTGPHGLIRFGSGDWNDGMNGFPDGESVFSTLFAILVLERYCTVAERHRDGETALFCRTSAEELRQSVEKNAWDGQWYLRGFADARTKVGAEGEPACEIDLLPQVFAVLAGGMDPARTETALEAVREKLVDTENRLIRLFTPPFADDGVDPGYLRGYVCGVRENGGQYTHAAVWYVRALLSAGRYDAAYEVLRMLNPVTHSRTYEDVKKYRLEPYVLAGDVYTNPAHAGMGGWSWYTGAAGWYFKTLTEEIFGLKRRGARLYLCPHLPSDLPEVRMSIRVEDTDIEIGIRLGFARSLTVDGKEASFIPLDGTRHEAVLTYTDSVAESPENS